MTGYPALTHISVPLLITEAGDDPWQIDATLQAGDPAEIAALSRAFFAAGACTEETYGDFVEAQRRFRAAWSREDGTHPINDGAEVRRAMASVLFQRDRLPVVAAGLAGIAACLAETQKSSAQWIDSLDKELGLVDRQIGLALARGQDPSALEDRAVGSTTVVAFQVKALRDVYALNLASAQTALRADGGYDPMIADADGDGEPGPVRAGPDAVDFYRANQWAADQETVRGATDSGAAGRLRDFRTATDPTAGETARQLAAARLDDFRMSRFTGPLPTDPVLGGDPRSRAQGRLDLQRRLETGTLGLPAMTADEATGRLDDAEHLARVLNVRAAVTALTGLGMSPTRARGAVGELLYRAPWRALKEPSMALSGAGAGLEAVARSSSDGAHYRPGVLTKTGTAEWLTIGKRLGQAGTVLDLVAAVGDIATGTGKAEAIGGVAGGLAGGALGTWVATVGAGSLVGPEGTLVAAVIASLALAEGGGWAGKTIGAGVDRVAG